MANLHAVIIVQKVLTDGADLDVYWDNEKQMGDDAVPDLSKYRNRAGKASDRLGQFLTPFAFGVAPLVQIIGSESPAVPTSKAVEIPLFKLPAGEGDRPIIDHIFAMMYPR